MVYYYKNHYIEQGELYCVYQSDHKLTDEEIEAIHNGTPELLKETTIYEGEQPFNGYPIKEKGTIRPATEKELVELGLITLKVGEILEGDNIKYIPQPSHQYKWENNSWVIDETKLEDGQIIENGEIKYIAPSPEMLVPKWNKDLKVWEDVATNLDIVQAQYREYEGMDTPSTLTEMKQQDPAMVTEYINMMIELRSLIYTLSANEQQSVGYTNISIPTPSESLKKFKNKFNLTR